MGQLNKHNRKDLTKRKMPSVLKRRCFPGEAEVSRDQDVPAVHYYCSCILGVTRLHLLQELQHPDGREGDPKVRPASEVELSHQTLRLLVRDVTHLKGKRVFKYPDFPSLPKSEGVREVEHTQADRAWAQAPGPKRSLRARRFKHPATHSASWGERCQPSLSWGSDLAEAAVFHSL